VGARDQYIPEAGAGATSGAVFGSGRGGNDVCGPLAAFEAVSVGLEVEFVVEDEELGLLAIADVERRAKGRR
jgi:hypothetical protein